jgi:hypothetical protein
MPQTSPYAFEEIRTFFMRRPWVRRVLSNKEYDGLRARMYRLPVKRATWLRAFIEGYYMGRPSYPVIVHRSKEG